MSEWTEDDWGPRAPLRAEIDRLTAALNLNRDTARVAVERAEAAEAKLAEAQAVIHEVEEQARLVSALHAAEIDRLKGLIRLNHDIREELKAEIERQTKRADDIYTVLRDEEPKS